MPPKPAGTKHVLSMVASCLLTATCETGAGGVVLQSRFLVPSL